MIGLACGLALGLAVGWSTPARGVDHIHSSTRFDRPVGPQVARFAASNVSVLTWTEVSARHRRAVVRRGLGDRWSSAFGADLGVSWRSDRWRGVWSRTWHLLDRQWLLTTVIQRDGRRLLVAVVHMPTRVEHRARFARSARAVLWRESLSRVGARVRAVHRRFGGAVLVCGDWNVSLRYRVFRGALRNEFPAMRLTWRAPLPAAGTHAGGRLIDGTITSLHGRARLVADDRTSDHRPYREVLW